MSELKSSVENQTPIFGKSQRPIVIAGPCSVETEEQVVKTAIQLKAVNKSEIFRAGIWKPRTSPDSFEGIGEKGLPWLQTIKDITSFPIAVEVANSRHVELCLKHDIDILWIGARSTANPFVVQEIAEALQGVDIPIMIKNPINPDLGLWLGSVERIRKAGIHQIGAIHRGFSSLSEKFYRNRPLWQLAIEFRRLNPDIPLFCDPSHICGRREIIQEVSQKAMDLGYDGLMIECHVDPLNAWSDAEQQLTPDAFGKMISEMQLRFDYEDNQRLQSELEKLREVIDHLDEEIINLLSERMKIAREIGVYKRENNVTIFQAKRWNEIIERSKKLAKQGGLNLDFILYYINGVHDESINQQESVMKKERD